MKYHVLVVDDEISIVKLLKSNLESEGYKVSAALSGDDALKLFEAGNHDLLILDINMPGINGFDVCRTIREWSNVPIILLSARVSADDKVTGLNLGADDYITKPFVKKELTARVKAVLRRTQEYGTKTKLPVFTEGALKIDCHQRRVTVEGTEVKLTPTEYNLLQELAVNAGKTLTHAHLLTKVWGAEYKDERDYLYVFIPRLRAKLGDNPENPQYVKTVSGIGYQFAGHSRE
ncbi:MAG: response regulator transcription factor [Dehalococcoidales bacterium]|jgi:two-component system KDP operon response regulator KdpE|nr:response regulator transcription factor [Dehalococcoidales bacterium]